MPKIKNEYLLLIIAVAWLIVFSFVLQLHPVFTLAGDEGSYYQAVERLYLQGIPDDGRPLLISAINGFPMLFGFSGLAVFQWILAVNLVCWLATVLVVYKIASDILNSKKGFVFALLFLFCIGNLITTYKLLSESVFVLMLVSAVFLVHKFQKSQQVKFLSLSVSILFLAVLVKPMALGLGVILLGWHFRKIKEILVSKSSVFIYVSLTCIFFQMYSVKKQYGDFTVSYIDSFTYYNYLGTRADCLRKGIAFRQGEGERYAYITKFESSEQKRIASADLKGQLKNNKINLAKAYILNFFGNSIKGNPSITDCRNETGTAYFNAFQFAFKVISKLQNNIFSILGIVMSFSFLWQWKRERFFVLLSIVILYVMAVSAISSDQGDRFHLVVYPLVLLQLGNVFFKRYDLL